MRPASSARVLAHNTSSCSNFLAVLGLTLIVLGFIIPPLLQHALDEGIKSAVIWRPESPPEVDARYRGSLDPSAGGAQDYLRVWLMNITNVEDIRQGAKPVLEQVGPFTYRKFKMKIHTWWDHKGMVSVKEYSYHIPVPELSGADVSAPIVTLNMPLIGVVEGINAAFGPAFRKLLDMIVSIIAGWRDGHVNGLFITRTATELIWGYEDLLLQRLSALLPHGFIKTTQVQLLHNMSGPGEAEAMQPTIYDTGLLNIRRIWQVVSDQGVTDATCWNNCSEPVEGSDGTQFHPGVQRTDRLAIWVPQLYRRLPIVYREDIEWLGVRFLRFWPDPEASEPDACHFQTLRGLMNITTPHSVGINGSATLGSPGGPPIFISPPFFCLCDPSLAQAVEGLPSCSEEEARLYHTTFIDVEPISGIPMRGRQRIMVSSEITKQAQAHLEPKLSRNSGNKSTIIPIYWSDEDIHGADSDVLGFKDKVYGLLRLKVAVSRWFPIAGASLLAVWMSFIISAWTHRRRQNKDEREDEETAVNDVSEDLPPVLTVSTGSGPSVEDCPKLKQPLLT